ncbi:hypothetical protein [Clostridium cochlearium]|uniref:hypothetical protein n=1 Tax=Clostridium cochlearium TaxID=1494 RepID=UPI001FA84DB1|nr:hypothetical protein [Clostridium cochlearium]
MARIRKNVSLDDEVLERGQKKADKMFAGNFSMYITYLINKDCEGIELKENNESRGKQVEDITIDKDTISEVDNILGI